MTLAREIKPGVKWVGAIVATTEQMKARNRQPGRQYGQVQGESLQTKSSPYGELIDQTGSGFLQDG